MTGVLSSIDPRIRARRVQVRRAEGRRRLRALLVGVAVIALAIGVYGLTRTPLLDLDEVRVEGFAAGSAESEAIVGAAGVAVGVPMLDIDTAAISAGIEDLPWIESASVSRRWPGTLGIEVVERTPVAVISAGEGSVAAVDSAGVVISLVPAETAPDLPRIAADLEVEAGETQETLTRALMVVDALPPDIRSWIENVPTGVGEEASLTLDLVGTAVAELGDTTLLADKITALRAVLAGTDLRCISAIDLSVPDLPAVAREPVCDAAVIAQDQPTDG